MAIIFNIIIFIMGITFGSFYTLAVYRIPKMQDILYTHSYCPNCNEKLKFLDLIPVLSYIFLGGKCRYCKQKIRPRYLILEVISGLFFVLIANIIGLNIYNINSTMVITFLFLVLYFTFIILMAGIDKENREISKPVLAYGIIISIMYMIYLCIIGRTSIYKYIIYLLFFIIFLFIDILILRKKAQNNYWISLIITILIMEIFTGKYIVGLTIIATLLTVLVISILSKILNRTNTKELSQYIKENKLGLYLSIYNITNFIIVLLINKIN